LLDNYQWLLNHCGASGTTKTLRGLKKKLAEIN
jgi:hypothetical protein